MSKQSLSVEATMTYEAVVAFLEDFRKSFKERKVVVQKGEQFVTLTPLDAISVEIEAKVKKGKQSLGIELEWKEEEKPEIEEGECVKVSSVEPEPAPETPTEPEQEAAPVTQPDFH